MCWAMCAGHIDGAKADMPEQKYDHAASQPVCEMPACHAGPKKRRKCALRSKAEGCTRDQY